MTTFAERVGIFNRQLQLNLPLPAGIRVINPYRDEPDALRLADAFYGRYFADNRPRQLILGINPGRFGAAQTGIPFTDFNRLAVCCGIDTGGRRGHEPSSEFIYRMIGAMGGAERFYASFFINSVCPLGFTISRHAGREVNYNYYDSPALEAALEPFILKSLHQLIGLGCSPRRVFCLGIRNAGRLQRLNEREGLFDEIVALPHPRYIIQYRRRFIDDEIGAYRNALAPYLQG